MVNTPMRRYASAVTRRAYTYRESVQAYWLLRQFRNRLRSENGCVTCERYLNAIIHNYGVQLGFVWAELQAMREIKKDREVA